MTVGKPGRGMGDLNPPGSGIEAAYQLIDEKDAHIKVLEEALAARPAHWPAWSAPDVQVCGECGAAWPCALAGKGK